MPWQPPIPSGALWSKPMRGLGPAKALIEYCYDIVRRDGWCHFKLVDVADAMGEPYITVKRWWKTVEDANEQHGFFAEIKRRGVLGIEVQLAARWLDWRIAARPEQDGPEEVSKVIPLAQEEGSKEVSKLILLDGINPREVSKEVSKEGSDLIPLAPAYKVLIESDQTPPPPTQPPRANAADAAGGGGGEVADAPGRWRDHPVYQLLTQKYGITYADRLMPKWQDAPADQVQKLLERLHKQHYSANAPGVTAGRMYRALEVGPGVLLRPPARAAPPPAPPPTPVPRSDARAIAAIFVEGRPNGKPPAD